MDPWIDGTSDSHSTCTAGKALGKNYSASKQAKLVVVQMRKLDLDQLNNALELIITDVEARPERKKKSVLPAMRQKLDQQGQYTRSVPAEAPVEQRVIVVAPSAIGLSSSASAAEGQDSNPNESSQVQAANQVVQSARRVVRFKERNAAIQEVPYERAAVNEQARMYANQGENLSVKGSGHFIWQDCFDILHRTKGSTVHVFTTVQPINGKRQYNQDMPERLQPIRKEAFDFEMEDSEEEL
ncbi:hypothetical protein B0J14DRAFT_643428 [Halenospora varia]|nr:hypothetical protein B0J14DRAFT_643428 [Halenospora varia]